MTELRTIKATGDVFIIPNSASKVSGYAYSETRDRLKDVAVRNGLDANEDFKASEIWIVGTGDLDTENFVDHGAVIGDEWVRVKSGLIPCSLIRDVKEGESFTVRLPAYAAKRKGTLDDREEVIVEMTLTARQKAYRYRNFGTFEECAKRTGAYSPF